MLSNIGPDIENEMDEIQRASQDLSRDENIDISVEEIVKSFENSKEEILSDDIWEKLENTESNEIKKGDVQTVFDIAKKYNKTNPRKLARSLKNGDYKRPLILNFDDRYILVAGNTRLSTASAMGMNPKVFIARVNKNKKIETKEATDSGSSGSYSAPLFSTIKRPITKIHNSKSYNINEDEEFTEATLSSSSGQYDVPFGGGPKGRKNPLKIDGEKSIKNSRAVKDKNFPKWGGPDSVFIKIKDKCKKFPYCNQGIDAIELLEMDELNESIKETSNKYGISEKEMKSLVLNEIKKIFI
jgi:hypothetical protein